MKSSSARVILGVCLAPGLASRGVPLEGSRLLPWLTNRDQPQGPPALHSPCPDRPPHSPSQSGDTSDQPLAQGPELCPSENLET